MRRGLVLFVDRCIVKDTQATLVRPDRLVARRIVFAPAILWRRWQRMPKISFPLSVKIARFWLFASV